MQAGLASGDTRRCGEVADEMHRQVLDALDRNDRVRLAKLGGQVDRLRSIVRQAGTAPELDGDLRRIARTAEIHWTTVAMRQATHAPITPEKFTVRELVLAQLRAGAQRPRDVANALGVDRTQVSRALRQLQSDGLAVQTAGARGEDHRASYWAAA